jgi:hypothetical protein
VVDESFFESKRFMWLAASKSILTKDVFIWRGWKGKDNKLCFSDHLESIDHLLFDCKLAVFVRCGQRCHRSGKGSKMFSRYW